MTRPTSSNPEENPIERIAHAVYSPFAMLAGMQLDLFTPLKDSPMTNEEIARAIGVSPRKLKPLLYALVAAGLLTVEGELFANTDCSQSVPSAGQPNLYSRLTRTLFTSLECRIKNC